MEGEMLLKFAEVRGIIRNICFHIFKSLIFLKFELNFLHLTIIMQLFVFVFHKLSNAVCQNDLVETSQCSLPK